jgi:8-oxo-dGTP pyrophosphatase MutT (NUDIX family)
MISKERLHAVSIVLVNEQNQILGVSRKYDHNDYGFAGGKIDEEDFLPSISNDENINLMAALMKGAIRETKEETGLDIFDLEVIYASHWNGKMQWTFLAKWSGEIYTEEPHVVKWIDTKTLMQGSFKEYNLEVLASLNEIGIDIK